jgi:hypothetical protein
MGNHRNYSGIEFCPNCGCKSIERDTYRKDTTGKGVDLPPEFLCSACGFGFKVSPSFRHQQAQLIFKRHRQLRMGTKDIL